MKIRTAKDGHKYPLTAKGASRRTLDKARDDNRARERVTGMNAHTFEDAMRMLAGLGPDYQALFKREPQRAVDSLTAAGFDTVTAQTAVNRHLYGKQADMITLGDGKMAALFNDKRDTGTVIALMHKHGYRGDWDITGGSGKAMGFTPVDGVWTRPEDRDKSERNGAWFQVAHGKNDAGDRGFFIRIHHPDGTQDVVRTVGQLQVVLQKNDPYHPTGLSDSTIAHYKGVLKRQAERNRAFSKELTGNAKDYGIDAGYKL